MDGTIESAGNRLGTYTARPTAVSPDEPRPALVLAHGFPHGPGGAAASAATYPEMADRLAAESGWLVFTFNFRGCGASAGQFSLGGWLEDLRAAVDHVLATESVGGVWLAGSSAGGALSVCAAAEDERVRGVATFAAPAHFADWAADAPAFLAHAREVGVISDDDFPPDVQAWARELAEIRPVEMIAKIPPRPVLILQGSADDVVPVDDAHALAHAGGSAAELHVLSQADHGLRHDPRAVAVLVGWLERQRAAV